MSTKQIFEDFPVVDCNRCELYYIDQCDGVSEAKKRPCNSFKATRKVIIPEQIKKLQKSIKILSWSVIITNLTLAIILTCFFWR